MAYDIYGNDLERGFCEVHPYIKQEYPCSVCLAERRKFDEEKKQAKQQQKEYYKHLEFQNPNNPNNETVRVLIDELVKRIAKSDLDSGSIDIDFGGQYMIQIQNKDTLKWIVTNAMNGGGYNCKEQFEKCEVIFLND